MYRLPNLRANGGPRLLDYLESSSEDAVGANHLKAKALGHIGDDAIDLLSLVTGKAGKFAGIFHHAGNASFGIFQDAVGPDQDGIDARLKLRNDASEVAKGGASLEE